MLRKISTEINEHMAYRFSIFVKFANNKTKHINIFYFESDCIESFLKNPENCLLLTNKQWIKKLPLTTEEIESTKNISMCYLCSQKHPYDRDEDKQK